MTNQAKDYLKRKLDVVKKSQEKKSKCYINYRLDKKK